MWVLPTFILTLCCHSALCIMSNICPCYYQLACYYVNNTSFIKVTIALYLDVLVDTHKTANRLHCSFLCFDIKYSRLTFSTIEIIHFLKSFTRCGDNFYHYLSFSNTTWFDLTVKPWNYRMNNLKKSKLSHQELTITITKNS